MGNISSVLKAKRKELGLTLAQIAEKIGVTEATVQRWESGNIKSLRHEPLPNWLTFSALLLLY